MNFLQKIINKKKSDSMFDFNKSKFSKDKLIQSFRNLPAFKNKIEEEIYNNSSQFEINKYNKKKSTKTLNQIDLDLLNEKMKLANISELKSPVSSDCQSESERGKKILTKKDSNDSLNQRFIDVEKYSKKENINEDEKENEKSLKSKPKKRKLNGFFCCF